MTLEEAQTLVDTILGEDDYISETWIASKNYIGSISLDFLRKWELEKIIAYCKGKGISELYYVPSGKNARENGLIPARIVPLDVDVLFKAEREIAAVGDLRAFFPKNLDFVVQSDGTDVHLFVGTEEFIKSVVDEENSVQRCIEALEATKFPNEQSRKEAYEQIRKYSGIT